MGIFGKKKVEKVKTDNQSGCGCGDACNEKVPVDASNSATADASVKVLGSGCTKCNDLEANTKAALEQLGMDSSIGHVTDFAQIAAFGVMTTPALVVDGKVVSYGKVLKTDEIVKILKQVRPIVAE
ncbi:MAG: thioredoxin family protein [Saccharofermentanales bacterium]